MKRGLFSIADDVTKGNPKFAIKEEFCDIFQAKVQVPKPISNLSKTVTWLCITASLAQITILAAKASFDLDSCWLYASLAIIELVFILNYALKNLQMIHFQLIYLWLLFCISVAYLFFSVSVGSPFTATFNLVLPSLEISTLFKALYVSFCFFRNYFAVEFHQQVYQAFIRQKFHNGNVVLQPQ